MKIAIGVIIGAILGSVGMFLQMKDLIQESSIRAQLRMREDEIRELKGEVEQRANRHDSGASAPELDTDDDLEFPKEDIKYGEF